MGPASRDPFGSRRASSSLRDSHDFREPHGLLRWSVWHRRPLILVVLTLALAALTGVEPAVAKPGSEKISFIT